MAERQNFHVRDSVASSIEVFADTMGLEPDHAAEILLALGNFVVSNLADGKEFLLKSGKQLNHIDWNLPEPHSHTSPGKPPTLRLVKW